MVFNNFTNMFFVFGTNESGRHVKGLAEFACKYRGAIQGEGYGLQGQSFAIPTKDRNQQNLPLNQITNYVDSFIHFSKKNPQMIFQINKIGCSNDGYRYTDIAPLFKNCSSNCVLSGTWNSYLFNDESRVVINVDSDINDEDFVFSKIDHLISNISNKIVIVHNDSNILVNKYCQKYKITEVILPVDKERYSTIQYSYIININDLIWYGSHIINIFKTKSFFNEMLVDIAKKENIPFRNIDYNKRSNIIS